MPEYVPNALLSIFTMNDKSERQEPERHSTKPTTTTTIFTFAFTFDVSNALK